MLLDFAFNVLASRDFLLKLVELIIFLQELLLKLSEFTLDLSITHMIERAKGILTVCRVESANLTRF